jgi:hypothetical protein
VGLELELLAPPSQSRVAFARALARRVKGRVELGFKYWSEGTLPDGRPLCRLSLAARVLERDGRALATIVDDVTLHGGLPTRPRARTLHATDDLRLALLVERLGWSASAERRLEWVKTLFGGFFEGGTLHDAFGHPLVVMLEEPAAHQRVCEVVTRPLLARERAATVDAVLDVAHRLRCTVPPTAALHAHYDAGPWRSVRALGHLIVDHAARRDAWWRALSPNPRCLKLAPFPPDAVRVAREGARVPFRTFAAALKLAGVDKACDVNVLGVIEPHPRQPTLEVRCLPMSLDAAAVLRSLEAAEALLAPCLR